MGKKNTSLTLDSDLVKRARDRKINISELAEAALRKQLFETKTIQSSKGLRDVFDDRPVLLVDHDITIRSAAGFMTAVVGTVHRAPHGEKTKVIRFKHNDSYSYALLIPSSSNLVDYSVWWLFYSFCNDSSGTGNAGRVAVEKCLKSLKGLVVKEVSIESRALREYADISMTTLWNPPTELLQR